MTMNLPEGQASKLTDLVESTRVVDPLRFEVKLKEPAAYFMGTVAYSPPAAIVSKDAVEKNGGVQAGQTNEFMTTNEAGSGPYKLKAWDRGERLTFDKFADYWNGPAKLDARWEVVDDPSVIVIGMKAGDFDLVEPTPQYVTELKGTPNVCFNEAGFLLEPLHLAFNLAIDKAQLPKDDTIPADFFRDPRIRQAFDYAFDYDTMVQSGLEGFGANPTYLPPGVLGWSEDAPKYQQDLGQAEKLFRETGYWDKGFQVSILVEQDNPTFTPVGLILKDSLEKLNPKFRVNVVQVAESQFDEMHGQTPFPYAMWIKNADPFTDPYQFMQTYHHPDGEWGEKLGYRSGYARPRCAGRRTGPCRRVHRRRRARAALQAVAADDPRRSDVGLGRRREERADHAVLGQGLRLQPAVDHAEVGLLQQRLTQRKAGDGAGIETICRYVTTSSVV